MNIEQLENQIREFINSGRRQFLLLKNTSDWNKLCSSLDLIGDTQLAINSYSKFSGFDDDGQNYLVIYGVLQALLLQQNAAKHIGDTLNIKVKLPKELEDIRKIRNSAGGHPTYQKEKGLSKSCFITRMSLTSTNFQLMTVYSGDKEYEFHNISVPFLISTQKTYVSNILEKIITELGRQEMEHRQKHNFVKLKDIFPQTLSYSISKIFEATSIENNYPLGAMNLKMITKCLDKFKAELSSRGEWGIYDSIEYHYELIEYPIKRVESYFSGSNEINEKDAYIYTSFIEKQMKSIKKIAIEIDEEYETEVEQG